MIIPVHDPYAKKSAYHPPEYPGEAVGLKPDGLGAPNHAPCWPCKSASGVAPFRAPYICPVHISLNPGLARRKNVGRHFQWLRLQDDIHQDLILPRIT